MDWSWWRERTFRGADHRFAGLVDFVRRCIGIVQARLEQEFEVGTDMDCYIRRVVCYF